MSQGSGCFADLTLGGFSEALASAAPTPGGGSAAAVAGSLAASLTVMVARLSLGRPRYAEHADRHEAAIQRGDAARVRFLELADEDAAAYGRYGAAMRMARGTPEEQAARSVAVRSAAREAAQVPREMLHECHALVKVTESLAGHSNVNAASDLDVAALLAVAAARSAAANVIVNLDATGDPPYADATLVELEELLSSIEATTARIHEVVRSGSSSGSGWG